MKMNLHLHHYHSIFLLPWYLFTFNGFLSKFIILNMEEVFVPKASVLKWNSVMVWNWDLNDETCAICRYSLADKCVQCQENQNQNECPPIFGSCCEHSCFHKHCLDTWFKEPSRRGVCPICKQKFIEKK